MKEKCIELKVYVRKKTNQYLDNLKLITQFLINNPEKRNRISTEQSRIKEKLMNFK